MTITYHRFDHPTLPPVRRKICEMALNGFTREEIADEMEVSEDVVSNHLSLARKAGVAVPACGGRGRKPYPVSNARMAALYAQHGNYAEVGREVGMTDSAVWYRLNKTEALTKAAKRNGFAPGDSHE